MALEFRSSKRIGTSAWPRLLRGWNKNKSFIATRAIKGGSRGNLTGSSYKYMRSVTTTCCWWKWGGGGGSNQRYFTLTHQFEALIVWLQQILNLVFGFIHNVARSEYPAYFNGTVQFVKQSEHIGPTHRKTVQCLNWCQKIRKPN